MIRKVTRDKKLKNKGIDKRYGKTGRVETFPLDIDTFLRFCHSLYLRAEFTLGD